MASIELTVKTLDSRNHKFTVSDELTVKELKEHIAGDVGTPADTQRLIYCGRVLQDDKKLSEYDLNGKVVHLVQRAPPSMNNPPSTGSPRASAPRPANIHYHVDREFQSGATHTFGPIPPPAGSSSLLRLNTARHMLEDASQTLSRINTVPSGDGPLFTMDNTVEGPYSSSVMPFAQAATAAALAAAFSTVQSMGANNITVLQGPHGPPAVQGAFGFRVQGPAQNEAEGSTAPAQEAPSTEQPRPQPQQIRNPRVTFFADVIEDMERVQQDLRPHLSTIRQLLRDDPVMENTSAEYRQAQHTYNQVAECLHYLAHALHSMSDLMVDFGAGTPREVRARPYVYQQAVLSSTIPIHASISVETTHPARTPRPATADPAAESPPNPRLPHTPRMNRWNVAPAPTQPGARPTQQRPPTVHMLQPGAANPFGRFPMAMGGAPGWPQQMAGHIPPMVYMEVRSNDQQQQQQAPVQQPEFDDFLPCHSRHLPRAARERPRTPASAAAPTAPGTNNEANQVPRPAVPPVIPSMADLMNEMIRQATAATTAARAPGASEDAAGSPVLTNAMFSSLLQGVMQEVAGVVSGQQSVNTVAHFLRNIPDFTYTAGESFLFDLFMTMAEHLTFRDLMALFYGMPEVLNQIRDHLRTFTRQRVLPSAGEFSEVSVRQGALTLVHQAMPMLQSAASEASVRPDVDFVATMANFMQRRLHDLLQLIGTPGENPNFGQLLMDQIRQSLTMAAALALACFTDGSVSLERVFLSQLRGVSDGVHPAVQEWTTNSSIERLRTLMASIDLDRLAPDINPMVMDVERGRAWTALFNAEVEEMQQSNAVPAAREEPMEVVEEVQPVTRLSRLERLRQEAAATPLPEPENSIDVVMGSQSWHSEVPREWVPVIARDIQRQNRAPPQAPLSDAYLAGIPNKRRKVTQGNRPSSNPQVLLRDTMERALRSANVSASIAELTSVASANPEVALAFLPEVRRSGAARLHRDADFDPERFPNAEKYFHSGN